MDREYTKEYYALERSHWWFVVREKILLQALRTRLSGRSHLRVLNIGAATGKSTQALAIFGEVTSVEFDPVLCEFLTSELSIPAVQASITELPFADDEFDLVCAFDVIEHVQDDVRAAQELQRVCRPGGLVAVTVPAFQSLWSRHDEINHHFRRYRSSQLSQVFPSELRLCYKTYFNSLLFLPIWLYRMFGRIVSRPKSSGSGSDFQAVDGKSLVNRILYWVFWVELPLLRYVRFPVGVSLLHLYIKSS